METVTTKFHQADTFSNREFGDIRGRTKSGVFWIQKDLPTEIPLLVRIR